MNILLKDFIEYLTIRKNLSSSTIHIYATHFKVFERWLKQHNAELSASSIDKFLYEQEERGLSNGTINNYIIFLFSLRDYYNSYSLPCRFFEGLSLRHIEPTEKNILTLDELIRLLSTNNDYQIKRWDNTNEYLSRVYSTFTTALALTGGRFSEIAKLKVADVDLSFGKLTFQKTKNKTRRKVDIPPSLAEKIWELIKGREPNEYVFTNSKGTPISRQSFARDLEMRVKNAGIKKHVTPHLLRHTFASYLYEYGGVELPTIARILGHKRIQTTYDTYLHLLDGSKRRAHFSHPIILEEEDPTTIIQTIAELIKRQGLSRYKKLHFEMKQERERFTFSVQVLPQYAQNQAACPQDQSDIHSASVPNDQAKSDSLHIPHTNSLFYLPSPVLFLSDGRQA